jgi:U32 family peptidase
LTEKHTEKSYKQLKYPEILAPAGDKNSFLAAIAAGADAVYCGMKAFSARMEADNFNINEMAALTRLAHSRSIKVYIAFNTLIKESETDKALRILSKLVSYVDPDALIIQDLAVIPLARQAGFKKEFHLSTLACLTSPSGIDAAKQMGLDRIVLPREFTIDEIRQMADHNSDNSSSTTPGLEIFIHGALCYSVSGRCWWSSWLGGKSALRGRCVQPCRRIYTQKGKEKNFFSCKDFSVDVLLKVLKEIPQIKTFKIEGRKKSPHYVYYTVMAYKLLRDAPENKKQALALLDYALGREFSHYHLLPQRVQNPLDHTSETGSGLFAGRIKSSSPPYFITREELITSDLLRIGCEEDASHHIQKVTRAVPKKGKFYLEKKSGLQIKPGTPVYIIDRRGRELESQINALNDELGNIEQVPVRPGEKSLKKQLPRNRRTGRQHVKDMLLTRGGRPKASYQGMETAVWISDRNYGLAPSAKNWLWLDPVLFPDEEKICADYIFRAVKKGAKNFVLNSPWQIALFPKPEKLNLWAGPFCNISNHIIINKLQKVGFSGVLTTPELDRESLMSLPRESELPLGLVIYGNWPLSISRIISKELKTDRSFFSPKGESAWISKHGNNYHLFPNWPLDLKNQKKELIKAGFSVFVHVQEKIPQNIHMKKRPGLWNFNLRLL